MSKEEVLGKFQVTAMDVLASTEKNWALEMERLSLYERCEGKLGGGLFMGTSKDMLSKALKMGFSIGAPFWGGWTFLS